MSSTELLDSGSGCLKITFFFTKSSTCFFYSIIGIRKVFSCVFIYRTFKEVLKVQFVIVMEGFGCLFSRWGVVN